MREELLLKEFQISWSKNKYWVMSRSQQAYNEIRLLAKGNKWSETKQVRYLEILLQCEQMIPSTKTLTVAYQHVWGYFKKQATLEEKRLYEILLNEIQQDPRAMDEFLKKMLGKYPNSYLLVMRWF